MSKREDNDLLLSSLMLDYQLPQLSITTFPCCIKEKTVKNQT
jgi:hypothetical protein